MKIKIFYKVSDTIYGTESYWEQEETAYNEAFRLAGIHSREGGVPTPTTKEELKRSWYDYIEVQELSMNCSV